MNILGRISSYPVHALHFLLTASVPSGVWYGVGLAVIIFATMSILLIYLVRRSILIKHVSPSSGAATSPPQHVAYNLTRETVNVTDKPESIMDLSSAGPPSYAEVEAEKEKYAAELPPTYPGLQPSDMGATAVQL